MEYHNQLLEANRDDSLPVGGRGYFREHAIDPRIAVKYRLGYVSEPLPGDERFANMISIPYLSPSGVQNLKFRNWAPGGSKYSQHNGQKGRLYNAAAYFDAAEVLGVAEGEMDSIAATEHLGIPTLGVPGANGWNELWLPLVKDFSQVLVFADGDDPGRQFAYSLSEKIGWRARVVECPDGEDVSSMAAVGRADELRASVTTGNGEDE